MNQSTIASLLLSRPKQAKVIGLGVHALELEQAHQLIKQACITPQFQGFVCATSAHGIIEAQNNEALQSVYKDAFLVTPDGLPLVWVGKSQGLNKMSRVYGPDLMLAILQSSEEKPLRHFLWGANDGVAQKLQEKLQRDYPYLEIVAAVTPPFRALTEQEELDLVEQIRATKPHCFWVGISTPKQDLFMHQFLQKYQKELSFDEHGFVMFGVGAAFDFHLGHLKQAPTWMQKTGLEWLFRMLMEPKRLFNRYVVIVPRFIFGSLKQIILGQNQPLD